MSALDDLRRQKAEADRCAEEERQKAADKLVADFRSEIEGEFGKVLPEFSPVYSIADGRYPVVTLTYRGREKNFGRRQFARPAGLTVNALLDWTANVDEAIEKDKKEKAGARESVLTYWLPNGYPDNAEGLVRQYSLGDDPEIATALKVAWDKVVALAEEAKRQEEEERAAQKADLIAQIKNASDLQTLGEITDGWLYNNLQGDDDMIDAEGETRARLTAEEEERDRKLAQAQAAEFKPFRWYRVVYAIVATSDEGETLVETNSFPSPTIKPTADGWWVPANGGVPVQVARLVRVERYDVLTVDDIPDWCHREYLKDCGGYIRNVPAGAELL